MPLLLMKPAEMMKWTHAEYHISTSPPHERVIGIGIRVGSWVPRWRADAAEAAHIATYLRWTPCTAPMEANAGGEEEEL